MAERAAHLVDHVFPDVPVRQWVLSQPYRGRAGKGRFRAGSIGRLLHWDTVNRAVDGTIHAFGVSIDTENLTDVAIDPSETEKTKAATGTRSSPRSFPTTARIT